MKHFRRFLLSFVCFYIGGFTNEIYCQAPGHVDGPCSLAPAMPATGQTLALNLTNSIPSGGSIIYQSGCSLSNAVASNGNNPVSGNVTAKVWVESYSIFSRTDATPLGGPKYISRHWEITPATNATTATGRVTLYCKQAEFDAYNNAGADNKLPTGPTDISGVGRLRVFKYSGTSSDGTGMPATYGTSAVELFVGQSGIVWNTVNQYWEISLNVTGFSGFFIGAANLVILPVQLSNFTAVKQSNTGVLNWKVPQEENIATYTIERSANGRSFTQIGSVVSLGNITTARSYSFTDASPIKGANYYRLKITEKDGKVSYSEVRLLNWGSQISLALFPNPAKDRATLTGVERGMNIRLLDAVGKLLQAKVATGTTEDLILSGLSKGFYSVQVYGTDEQLLSTVRIVKD